MMKYILFHVSQMLFSGGNTVTEKKKRDKKNKETYPFILNKTLQF